MKQANSLSKKDRMSLIYKEAADHLLFLKRQQWIITNYSLAVSAAVIALTRTVSTVKTEKVILTILLFGVFGCALACIVQTQRSMTKVRIQQHRIWQDHFTKEENIIFGMDQKKPGFFYSPLVIFILIFANIASVTVATYLIWRNTAAF